MAIFTAIGTAVAGALFAGSALAATVISAGLAVGAQLAVSYFTRQKQKASTPTATTEPRTAISGAVQFGADVSRWVVYGKAAVRGHQQYYAAYGPGDKYNAEVFVLADGWNQGLEPEVIFYGEKHTLVSATKTGSEDEHWKVGGFGDLISIRFYSGKPTQVADTKLVTDTASLDNPFTSSMKFTNQSYVVVEKTYDKDKFADGEPQMTFVLKGLRCYDWRLDSTVSGGSGAHRVDDESTWAWTPNPAVCRFNYQIGLRGRLSGRTLVGMGLPTSALHLASYTVAANACDATRTVGGRTIATYQIGMMVDADMDHTEVLRDFDDAMAGYTLNASGLSGIIVGAPQIVAHTITVDDVRMDAQKTLRNRRDTKDLYNHMTGTFLSPEALWNAESLDPVKVNADVSADKRQRSLAYDFTQVFDPDVAQYLLNIRYRQGRKGAYAMLPVSNRMAFQVEAGDWVTYNSKTWIVMGRRFGDGGYMLELAETGADVYSETGITAGPVITAPSPPAFVDPPTVSNLAVQAVTVSGNNDIPGLKVTWTPPDDPRVDAVVLEYRIAGETDAQRVRDDSPEDGVMIITGLASGADYEVRATFNTTPARVTQWTSWVAITTSNVVSDIVIPDTSVNLAKLDLDVQGLFAAINRLRQDNLTQADIIDDLLATSQSVDLLERYSESRETRAFVATESSVRVTEEEALAALVTTVSTTLDGNSADISWVQTSQNGQAVRFGILGNINGATGGFQFTGINLDGETSYTFEIDGDLIVDGTITANKLQANELSALSANLGTVTAGKMQSADGKMVVDLDNKIIRITA